MGQKVAFRMRNMRDSVVGNIVAIVQESVGKVAAWATHGEEKERYAIGVAHRYHVTHTTLTSVTLLNSSTSTSGLLFLIMKIYAPSPTPGS